MLQLPTKKRRTWVHKLPSGLKLVGTLSAVLVTAVFPRRLDVIYFAPVVVLVFFWVASRMPLGFAIRRLLLAEFFIIGIAGLSLLVPGNFPVFASAILKSNVCVGFMVLLVWTTPFSEILTTLRRLRMPSVMLTTIALLYRYLPVLAEESARMQRAMASRTFTRTKMFRWRGLSAVAGRLFIRSADRAERIYMAMCARGWK